MTNLYPLIGYRGNARDRLGGGEAAASRPG